MRRTRILLGMFVLALSLSFVTTSCMVVDESEVLRGWIDGVLENMTPTVSVTDVKMIVDRRSHGIVRRSSRHRFE